MSTVFRSLRYSHFHKHTAEVSKLRISRVGKDSSGLLVDLEVGGGQVG